MSDPNPATITAARVVGGHDGRAEVLVEITYPNGGTTTISLRGSVPFGARPIRHGVDRPAVGEPWSTVLPTDLPRTDQPALTNPH